MGLKTGKKRLRVEREKIRHTTHWDLDYLPKEVVAEWYRKTSAGTGKTAPPTEDRRRQRRLGLVLMGAGAALLAGAILLGRFIAG